MRITKFEAENFKRLKAVSIDPDTNTVVLGGRNAQGKSSVLDGIMAALVEMGFTPEQAAAYSLRSGASMATCKRASKASKVTRLACPRIRD